MKELVTAAGISKGSASNYLNEIENRPQALLPTRPGSLPAGPQRRHAVDDLAKHLITTSSRFNGRMDASTRAGVAGRFTYEPPPGVVWSG